jgi:hypothetical protein
MCFWFDMVNSFGGGWPAITHALLAQMLITLKYPGAPHIPFAAIAALVSALTTLMLLPAFIDMVGTVA